MDEIKADLIVAGKMNGVSSWVIKEISNGFGTFKRRACENCGHMRAQMPLR